jgi:hypothetical protein
LSKVNYHMEKRWILPHHKHLLYNQHQTRSLGTRRKRNHPSYGKHQNKSLEYWDQEYIKTKEQFDSINKNKLQFEEPKQLNDIISWRVLLVMAISPLVLCMIIPDLRNQMFDSLDNATPSNNSNNDPSRK